MIITIGGELGSGKSSVTKYLAKNLGFEYYSIGDLMGDVAMDQGLTLLELSKKAEEDRGTDELLDEKQIYYGEHKDNFVIDSRLGWHFIPHSFKIYLKCNIDVAAKRIYGNKRPDEKENITIEATKENIIRRAKSEKKRYQEYYGLNPSDETHYDYVLETTNIGKQEVMDLVLNKVLEIKKQKFS